MRTKISQIRIISVNVGRSSSAHQIALQTAYTTNIDILLVQEPYISRFTERRITCNHPSFECFTPLDDWSIRPRVLTYTRKNTSLTFTQYRPNHTSEYGMGDVLFLTIQGPDRHPIQIINIYNAPPGAVNSGAGVSFLLSLTDNNFPPKTILAGDLNLHHPNWNPSYQGSPSTQSGDFIRWLEDNELFLLSEVDVPTHNLGNVLDLCFASSALMVGDATAAVQPDLDVSSDHQPILISLSYQMTRNSSSPKLRFSTIEQEKFLSLLKTQLAPFTLLAEKSDITLDKRAEELSQILLSSFAGSAKQSLPHNKGQPWWNEECREARKRFKEKIRDGEVSREHRKAFRKVVRRAKTLFYQKITEQAVNARDVFKITKWHKSKGMYRTPPLLDPLSPNSPPVQSTENKRDVLARNLLCNKSQAEDILLSAPAVPRTSLPFPNLTSSEVSKAILGASNTTPGKDQIPSGVLRLAWPHISEIVLDLFQACIDIGYHPKCFRTAIVAIIAKPNKLDMSSPSSYRPIALLSVLGKGLERLVAKRMSWVAIKYKVLARQQFGALPLRSSVDLTTSLTHDIETALAKGMTASVATLDIKGAFDAVLPGRLVRRLREQGWPAMLCDWVSSFATKRKVCIRIDGQIGEPREIDCGLPQGSPVSPILFMLYISPLFKLKGLESAFGYADDVAIPMISSDLDENTEKIRIAINQALSWGEAEGVTFDPGKSELIHFSRKHRDKDRSPTVNTNRFTISESTQKPYLKWLGVHFDKKLTFKYHVQILTAKALKVANALRCLGNTLRGVSPKLSRQAAIACVLPIAHFGAQTWWPGKYRNKGNKTVCNRVGIHISNIQKVHLATARAILPVYCTTPTASLLRESGLLPAEIALDNIAQKAAIRTYRLDPRHPLRLRREKSLSQPVLSRFARSCKNIPISENFDPLINPPWEVGENKLDSLRRIGSPTGPTEMRAINFQNFLETIPRQDILIYSDGSKLPDGNSGSGFVVFQFGLRVCSGATSLGNYKDSYDAEAHGALQGLRAAISLPSARFSNDAWVFLDNLDVARKLLTTTSKTSQSVFLDFAKEAKKWRIRSRLPHTQEGQIRIHWVPGHVGIEGNELADFEAKKGAAMPHLTSSEYSAAALEQWHSIQQKQSRINWWNNNIPNNYAELEIKTAPNFPKELLLSRKALGQLIAARTGHGDFSTYHTRFKHNEANLNCRCGSPKSAKHFLFCRILHRRGGRPPGSIHQLLPILLGTPEGAKVLGEWLEKSRFFEEICPR